MDDRGTLVASRPFLGLQRRHRGTGKCAVSPPADLGGRRQSREPDRGRDAGFKVLLDQVASFEKTGERIAVYRERIAALGREYSPGTDVAVTRSLHLVDGRRGREAAIRERVEGFAQTAALTNSPSGPQNRMAAEYTSDIRSATEEGAIIGDVDECVERLERLRDAGAEYVLLIDRHNSPQTLRAFAREIMPRLAAPALSERA